MKISINKRYIIAGLLYSSLIATPVNAQSLALHDIQDMPSANAQKVDSGKVLSSSGWEYKTLENISKKYGLILGETKEKFNQNRPLTRNEAAVILISIEGKIKQDNVQLTNIENDRINLLKEELNDEITSLTQRVSDAETSVSHLQGRISDMENNNSKNIAIGYGDKFKINGALQLKYTGNIDKGADTTGTVYPSGFNLPIADMNINGQIAQHLRYSMQLFTSRNYGNGSVSLSQKGILGDAYLSSDIVKNNTIYVGQSLIPIGKEGFQCPYTFEMINPAQISRLYSGFRTPGVKIIGNYPLIDYYTGIFNGDRDNGVEVATRQQEYASWAVLKPLYKYPKLGRLELGGGYDYGKGNYANITQPFSHNTTGFYAGYTDPSGKYNIQCEFSMLNGYLKPEVTSRGWYVNNSYYLTPKLQLESRIDQFDPNTDATKNLNTEFTVGSNYYLLDKHIKLMLDYVYVTNQSLRDSSRIISMMQYMFY